MTKMPAPPLPEPMQPMAPPPGSEESADLFDYKAIRQWVAFIWRSVGRHKLGAITGFLAVFGLSLFLAWVWPKKYESMVKLLANRGDLMAQLGNPHRSQNWDMDGPTRAAQEQVMARDNLVATIKQTNLLDYWDNHRHPVLKLKDRLITSIAGAPTEDQRIDNMIGTLEKRLNVFTGDGTVTIEIYWPDAQMARQLVETAQQNFLEARHVGEVSAISEAISILELHASEAQSSIDEAVTNVQKVAEERRGVAKKTVKELKDAAANPAPRPVAPKPAISATETPQQELAQLKFLIRTKRRAVSDLEEFRSRRLTELQSQLAEQKVIYSANHPVVIDIQQRIDAMQKESPQIEALKRDEQALIEEYKARGGKDPDAPQEPGTRSATATVSHAFDTEAVLRDVMPDMRDDPAVMVAQDQLRMAISRYQDILMRLDAARIELDTARAAFKYRYSVVSPAQTPRHPISPNVLLIVLGGLLGGLFFAFFTGTVLDLWKGRIVEPWQVETQLKIPLLAQVKT